jgi:hypothetical protein
MDLESYRRFTRQLTTNLSARDDVLGLVAVGSMAERDYLPDAWSDHDFFVITRTGAQEPYRVAYTWLPDADAIVYAFRETAHGVKVVYASGHLLEYAVFDREELAVARVNRYRVLLDRDDIGARLAQLAQESARTDAGSDAYHAGQFLTNLLVGVGRYRRGEILSAHHFVKASALHHLAILLQRYVPSPDAPLADNLAPLRRFERVHPDLGGRLRHLLLQPVPQAAAGMLDLFQGQLQERHALVPPDVVAVFAAQIAASAEATAEDGDVPA